MNRPAKPYKSDSHTWLKAEAFCAALIESGIQFDDIILQQLGTFRRSYRADIENVAPDKEDSSKLRVEINRDGLYDRLPEGLFHQPRRSQSNNSAVTQMVGEYRRFREEEKAARRFFLPIEQELFRYTTAVEQAERESLWGLQSGTMQQLFSGLWDLPAGLPEEAAPVLVGIMPWAWHIKGNMDLTGRALSMILNKPVTVTQKLIDQQPGSDTPMQLGDGVLGVDTVTGSSFDEASVCWEFCIGDLAPSEVTWLVGDGAWGALLQHFVQVFVPLEVDVTFVCDLTQTADDAAEKVLGFSFML